MKKLVVLLAVFCSAGAASAQCSLCTKTAQQLGEGPAKGLNSGILYLMAAPFAVVGLIGYKWWKREKIHLLNSSTPSPVDATVE